MNSSKAEQAIQGEWRITETKVWGPDALDCVQSAFIRFDEDRLGEFAMVALRGRLDCFYVERDGKPAVEFSWEGEDDGDDRCGRGWATLDGDGALRGRFFIHLGDHSAFVAERPTEEGPSARRPPRRGR